MDSDFARQYYESAAADHWWFRGRRDLVHRLVEQHRLSSGTFVDLGAGAESLLPSILKIAKVDLVVPSPTPNMFVRASVDALPFPRAIFEGVGLFDVLEHLPDPELGLAEVRRVLRPEGLLLVTVPAYQWLWSPHDELVGHERRYNIGTLSEELEAAGFELVWISAFYGFLLLPAVLRKVFSLQSPMATPPPLVNQMLTGIAQRSVRGVMRHPSRVGLSIAAMAVAA